MQGAFAITPRRLALVVLASALCVGPLTARTHAVPPAAAGAVGALSERWIEHRVAPGERIAEIGDYYGVGASDIIGWNKLDKDRPMIRTGQQLRILTSAPSQSRERASYVVRRGDSWATLAKRFEVTIGRLRDQWNNGEESLRMGERIVVFRIPEPEPEPQPMGDRVALTTTTPSAALSAAPAAAVRVPISVAPVIPEAAGAQSVGRPDRGRIANAAQLPANGSLYTVRNPDHSWGSSHAIALLTRSIQEFRTTGFSGEVVIQDMSRKSGGRFRPHRSHQSGRDVDIRLPLRSGLSAGTIPTEAHQVDWDAAWALMRAMLDTGRVRFIFLSRPRQKQLYEAALRAGATEEELAPLLQYPRHSKTAVIRHSRGHTKHFHVRFSCGPDEPKCIDPGFETEPVEP